VEDSTPNWPSGVGSIIRNYLEVMKAVDMSLLDGSVASLRKRAIDQLESVEKVRPALIACKVTVSPPNISVGKVNHLLGFRQY